MSNMKKLLDIMNETTVSGSIAAGPAVGLGTQRRVQEEDSDDGTKAPDAPKAKEFGLWKNSVLAGAEQRDKKKSKKVAESKSEERNEMDTPAVQSGLKKMAARHNNENWTKEQLADLGRRLASVKTTRKNGYTEFNGIDKAIIRSKKVNELDCGSGQRQLKLAEENISEEQLLAKELARRLDLFMKGLDRDLGKKSSDRGIQSKTEPSTGAMREDNKSIGPDKNDPFEKGWRARYDDSNPYEKGTKEHHQWQNGKDEREAQPNHYDESVTETIGDEQVISQEQIANVWTQNKNKVKMFIKAVPVAIVPAQYLPKLIPPKTLAKVKQLAGQVDSTSYSDEYEGKGMYIFQMKDGQPDIYIGGPNVLQKYVKFTGQIPTETKPRSKIPSITLLDQLGLDASKFPLYIKKVPTPFISAAVLGVEGKQIETSWGNQTVEKGAWITQEENGHTYCCNPDAQGLPIGYIPVQGQQGVAEGSYNDTRGTFIDRVVGEILNYQSLNNVNPKLNDLSSAVKSKLKSLGEIKAKQIYQQALKQSAELSGQQDMTESKITLSTDPNWYGAEVGDYKATGPVVNIPTTQLVGFEPDDKMNQSASKANVEKIVAGLKKGAKLPPLMVRKYKNGYQVLDGHHRFWAYKLLGVKSIPVQIVPDSDIEEKGQQDVAEEGKGLWANIHAKQNRIKNGSGEHMRKPGSKGAPTKANFKSASKTEGVAEDRTEKEYHVINHRGTPTVVSPSGKMNKNFSSTYDAQQFAKKKNAEIGKKKDVAEDAASVKYGVFSKGGSVGDQKWKNDPIKTFDNKEEAIAFAKHRRAGLSKGEKAYYRMSYVVKPIKNTTEKQVNEHGDPWEDPNYDPRGGGETRSPEQIAKDNAEHAILSKKLGLKNTNKLPDIKDDMLKMMNHFMGQHSKKKDVTEATGYKSQFPSAAPAIQYAKDKVKTFRDPDDGIEIWSMPDGGCDVVHTSNSNGRYHCIDNRGKKLGTIRPQKQGNK